jgi:hypothetical protein
LPGILIRDRLKTYSLGQARSNATLVNTDRLN